MKHYGVCCLPSWTMFLYEAFRLGEVFAEGAVPTPQIFHNGDDSWPELFRRFVHSTGNNYPLMSALGANEIIYLRNIRPDSLIQLDMGLNGWPKPRLIDDVFIFRTHQEHCFIRCDNKWSPNDVALCLGAFIRALNTPGVLTGVNLHVVWLAPLNKQGAWINFDRRAVVQEVFYKNDINYGSSYYIQEAEPDDDCHPSIQVRTTCISPPLDREYPWILKTWANLEYWTPWNDERGQVIEIDEPYQPEEHSGQVIHTPTIGDNLPIPNPGWPRNY